MRDGGSDVIATESATLGLPCRPGEGAARSEREMLVALGQAEPAGTPAQLAAAAASRIADCDPDRCFEDRLGLLLAGLRATESGAIATTFNR